MGEPAKRRATYEDVLRAPPHMVAEIIEGDLVLSPRPGPLHALATTKLVSVLGPRFGGKDDGCIILIEPELHLGPHVLVPWEQELAQRAAEIDSGAVKLEPWSLRDPAQPPRT
jgi:hypothetical protein